ncbi:hypothetical protein M378DRAFT_24495 [Amanita muscaria Koide BX008]|uniref:DUF6534 domain-containing protein n=1 Tax=Amanita muscaria (strain Koide BX008) TaxID=946122 RepID=A0A0C2X7B4_AMAMK|nr:hypothetical protein M378DRAFT_24495 [Amanita muscaria Koide BX008]
MPTDVYLEHGTENSTLILTMLQSSDPRIYRYTEITVTVAALVVGNLVNWLLHGVLTLQICLCPFVQSSTPVSYQLADLYYLAFPNDKTWTKTVVYTAYILETVQVIGLGVILLLIVAGGSSYAGPFILDPSLDYRWTIQALLMNLVGGLLPFIAQGVYAHRIQIITQRKVIPRLAILQLSAAIITAVISAMILIWLWIGLTVINDLIITFMMVRSLLKEKPLSNDTKSKVIRLVRLIIATGLLTVTANILSFTFLLLDPYRATDSIGIAILIFIPKLYGNSILVMMNNRMTIRNSRDVTPNMISINALSRVSTLVIADHSTGTSDSATPRDEVAV